MKYLLIYDDNYRIFNMVYLEGTDNVLVAFGDVIFYFTLFL